MTKSCLLGYYVKFLEKWNYENDVHTQNVESYNNKVKLRIKIMKGIKKETRNLFLCEFMWLDIFVDDCFDKTLALNAL